MNLYKHAKNEAVSLTCSGEIVDLNILLSDWLRAFLQISQEHDFSLYRNCVGTQFIKEHIQGQLMTKFFFKFKKPYLETKTIIPKTLTLSCTTS